MLNAKNRLLFRILCIALIAALMLPTLALAADGTGADTEAAAQAEIPAAGSGELTIEERLDELLSTYKQYHLDDPTDEDLLKSLIYGLIAENPELFDYLVDIMVNSYDHYNHYMSDEEHTLAYYPPEYYGIGVQVEMQGGYITVTALFDGSAARGGMQVGDRIVAVNGESVLGMSVEDVGYLIRGERDTPVSVSIERGVIPLTFELMRGPVYEIAVTTDTINGKIGYIAVDNFDDFSVFYDFAMALREFEYNGITRLIIDLRGNRGGEIQVGLNMINQLITESDVEIAAFREYDSDELIRVRSNGEGLHFPAVAVLVNGNSASTSEVFAGAVQDLGLGAVIGKRTVGKGRGQIHMSQSDGSYLIVTVSEVYLPKQQMYDGAGITPDIDVDNRYVPVSVPAPLPVDYDNEQSQKNIAGAEHRLSILGYYDAPTFEGTVNENYTAALSAFQRDRGLAVTGVADASTLRALDDAVIELSKTYRLEDTQLDAAIAWVMTK